MSPDIQVAGSAPPAARPMPTVKSATDRLEQIKARRRARDVRTLAARDHPAAAPRELREKPSRWKNKRLPLLLSVLLCFVCGLALYEVATLRFSDAAIDPHFPNVVFQQKRIAVALEADCPFQTGVDVTINANGFDGYHLFIATTAQRSDGSHDRQEFLRRAKLCNSLSVRIHSQGIELKNIVGFDAVTMEREFQTDPGDLFSYKSVLIARPTLSIGDLIYTLDKRALEIFSRSMPPSFNFFVSQPVTRSSWSVGRLELSASGHGSSTTLARIGLGFGPRITTLSTFPEPTGRYMEMGSAIYEFSSNTRPPETRTLTVFAQLQDRNMQQQEVLLIIALSAILGVGAAGIYDAGRRLLASSSEVHE